jgi:hypothetical protein
MNWIIPLLIVIALAFLGLYFYEQSRPKLEDDRRMRRDSAYGMEGHADIEDEDEIRHGEYRTMADSTKGDYTAADEDQHVEYDEMQKRAARTRDE